MTVAVGSIVEVCELTRCASIQLECYLKTTQIDVKHSLIRELVVCEFELG